MPARRLFDLPITLYRGLVTKFSPKETIGTALIQSDNADGFDVSRGYGKIPGTEAVTPTVSGTSYHSLHFYNYTTLSGTTAFELIGVRDSNLTKLETNQTTVLAGGLAAEPVDNVTTGNILYATSQNNDPIKYDSAELYKWGVFAPGDQETVIVPLNSADGFGTVNSNDAVSTSTVSKDGGGSLKLSKGNTTSELAAASGIGTTYNFSQGGDNVHYWVHIPKPAFNVRRQNDATVELVLGSGTPDFWASRGYQVDPGDLSEGWNLITEDLTAPDTTSNTLDLSQVSQIQLNFYTQAAGNTFDGVLFDKIYKTDSGAMTASTGAAGNVSGTHTWAATFVTRFGHESNLGPVSNSLTVGGNQVTLTGVPVSDDPQVVGRDIYRDSDGNELFQFVLSIDNNVDTGVVDNVGTASSDTPPEAGSSSDDNSPPPRMRTTTIWNNHIFGIDSDNPTNLNIMTVTEPESLPTAGSNILTFEKRLVALSGHSEGLYIFANDTTWIITGDSVADFTVTELNPNIGCTGRRALVNVNGEIIAWHDTGPYLWLSAISASSRRALPAYLGNPIQDIIQDLDPAAFREIHVVHDQGRFRVVFFIQSTVGGKYDTVLTYNYGHANVGRLDTQGYVDPHDLRQGYWSKVVLPDSVNPLSSVLVQDENNAPQVYIGTDDGNVYHLQKEGVFSYAQTPASGTVAVETTIKTNIFPLGTDNSQYGRLRYLELNTTATNSGTINITYETLSGESGVVLTSTGVPFYYDAGDSSRQISFKQTGRPGGFGRLEFSNTAIDEDFVLNSVNAKVVPLNYRGIRSK